MAATGTQGERLAGLVVEVQTLRERTAKLEDKFDRINGKLTAILTVFIVALIGLAINLIYAIVTNASTVHP